MPYFLRLAYDAFVILRMPQIPCIHMIDLGVVMGPKPGLLDMFSIEIIVQTVVYIYNVVGCRVHHGARLDADFRIPPADIQSPELGPVILPTSTMVRV